MITKDIEVTQAVRITIDESKFTPEFMSEFREYFYDFTTLDEHLEHLGQLAARGLISPWTEFIEGYGKPADLGIRIEEPEVLVVAVVD